MKTKTEHITPETTEVKSVKESIENQVDANELPAGFEPYISIDKICSIYHIAKKTIQNWCAQSEINDLPYYKMGKVVLFRLSEFDLWFRISKGSKAAKTSAMDKLMSLAGKSSRRKFRFA